MLSLRSSWSRRIGALAVVLVASGLLWSASARAEEDGGDEFTFEQKIIRKLLGVDGDDIEYRERSPLVIPPSGNLPPPAAGATAVKPSPAWPADPDAQRRKQAAKSAKKPAIDAVYESQRPLRPDELRQGTTTRSAATAPAPNADINSTGRPLAPSEIGEGKSLLSFFGIGGGSSAASAAPPEPESRTRLTQPPTAYRTPTANQPYAPPKETGFLSKMNPFDRGTCEGKTAC